MKLHTFVAEIREKRFCAFTGDKARKALCNPVPLSSHNLQIDPDEWNYTGVISTDGQNKEFQNVLKQIKKRGFAISPLSPINSHFFVFDLSLDIMDVRIYSADKKLSKFNVLRHQIELSPKGKYFGGKEPVFVGELEISDAVCAKKLGLDFDRLQVEGFQVVIVGHSSEEIFFERAINRLMPESFPEMEEKFGIKISDFNATVKSIKKKAANHKEKDEKSDSTNQPVSINIENKNILSQVMNERKEANRSILDSWVVKFIGFLAAVVGLLVFFFSK